MIKQPIKTQESEAGRVFYLLEYIRSDNIHLDKLTMTKYGNKLYIKTQDLLDVANYIQPSVKMYRFMNRSQIIDFIHPEKNYERPSEFISIQNAVKWLTGSSKKEAKYIVKFLHEVNERIDDFVEVVSTGYIEDKDESENIAEYILSDSRFKDIISKLIKEYLSK